MTRLPVVFHPAVEDDLADALDVYGAFDPVLSGRFEARLDEQVERLSMYPESGAVLFDDYRRVSLTRFPYMLVYAVRAARIDVLALLASRRDPAWIEDAVKGRAGQ